MGDMRKIDFASVERLQEAIEKYEGNVEKAINEVLHDDATADILFDSIRNLIPVSGKTWKGKRPAAKSAKSLRNVVGNLAVTITTMKNYQYLYFPDDGSSTKRHAGNMQFFRRGGEKVQDEIVDRCVNNLVKSFEEGV